MTSAAIAPPTVECPVTSTLVPFLTFLHGPLRKSVVASAVTVVCPSRSAGASFGVTAQPTTAVPCPSAPPENAIHGASAVQAHSRSVLTERAPDPPPALNDEGEAEALTSHFNPLGAVVDVDVLALQRASDTPATITNQRRAAPCGRNIEQCSCRAR
jgi:hypothetical protein